MLIYLIIIFHKSQINRNSTELSIESKDSSDIPFELSEYNYFQNHFQSQYLKDKQKHNRRSAPIIVIRRFIYAISPCTQCYACKLQHWCV